MAVIFSARCVYPNSLCIIHYTSTLACNVQEIVHSPMNFQICGHRTAVISIQVATKCRV